MKPFAALSRVGKLRRLRELAVAALADYDLSSPSIAFHGFTTNLIYRVTNRSGRRFMLRLASPGWRTLSDLQSEAMWLNSLARDTSIQAPRVIPALDGRYVMPMSTAMVPVIWNVTLMTWVPGRLLGRYLNRRNIERMGALFAELHHHGATWTRPPGFTTRIFDHWLSRDETNLIVGDGDGDGDDKMPLAGADPMVMRMNRHVKDAYAALDPADLRVIHCDLWHDNIKIHKNVLHPFDFEDTVLGYRAHDIAMAMLDLLEDTDDEVYPGLFEAFRVGYESGLPWIDDRIEPFQIGRLLWKLNWIARNQPERFAASVQRHLPVFATYEHTGRLVQPPK